MNRYIVNISDEALADMENIYNYIAYELLATENAEGPYDRIADAILKLDSFPERFKIFESEPEHSLGIRRMVVDNYLVCYVVDPDVVTVVAVLYGASDVHTRLREKRIDGKNK